MITIGIIWRREIKTIWIALDGKNSPFFRSRQNALNGVRIQYIKDTRKQLVGSGEQYF